MTSPLCLYCNMQAQCCDGVAHIVNACEHFHFDQVDKLYWDGEVVQKTRKKDHKSKAEQLWKVISF